MVDRVREGAHFYRTQLLCESQRLAGSEEGIHAAL
nr:MAG TPA: hypothetical protein [Caudoviricetes sp.]DAU99439.1 MAG TPA: hypothetical protein [Caudoviricetes sp.]